MERDRVAALLAQSQGYLSGEEMSRALGVTRAAVWKEMEALRREGWPIESSPRKGYRLAGPPPALSGAYISAQLPPDSLFSGKVLVEPVVDSTNTRLKAMAAAGAPEGTALIAEEQTGGRGTHGRSFQSPKGQGIYLSVLLRPFLTPDRLPPVTALAGVSVCAAVERVCGARPGLKWPNDPVLKGKKLCGILTELSLEAETGRVQSLVLGIGVNVGQRAEDFSPEVAEMATSLSMALGRSVSRPALAAAEIRALDRLYARLLAGDLTADLEAYRRSCVNLGKTVQLISPDGTRETAQALDIDRDFSLVVRTGTGETKTVRSGEVSVRGMYGYTE